MYICLEFEEKIMIKKLICFIMSVLFALYFVSCDTTASNYYDNEDFYTKQGEITVSARFAYYNNGQKYEALKNIDKEKYKEKTTDDGSFTIYFAVSNLSKYDKKITEIGVEYIRNSKNHDIVKETTFDLDSDFYVAAGETRLAECNFEKSFVKMTATLDELKTKTTVSYEGCVINGKEPENNGGIGYSVKEAKFTVSSGLEGSFYIKNFTKTNQKIGKIRFMLYTDKNIPITKKAIEISVDDTIGAGKVKAYNYGVLQNNIDSDIKNDKLFNSIIMKVED